MKYTHASRGRSSRSRAAGLGVVLTSSLIATFSLPSTPASAATASAAPFVIYGDELAKGWSDWSWGASVQLRAAGSDGRGHVVQWRADRPWAGLYLHSDRDVSTSAASTLQFAVKAEAPGTRLAVTAYGERNAIVGRRHLVPTAGETLAAGRWTTVRVPLSDLLAAGQKITGFAFQGSTGAPGQRFELDDLRLLEGDDPQPSVARAAEVRPGNAQPNATRGRATDPARFFGHEGFRPYYAKIDGNFTGTTEEILSWAAAKWGMDRLGYPDLAKAVAVHETWWRQEFRGRANELGILQVNPSAWPDAGPAAWSTAYSADYGMAVIRHHYDGASWLGEATRGNLRNSVAAWECGCGWSGGNWYANRVFDSHGSKVWQRPGVAPDWF